MKVVITDLLKEHMKKKNRNVISIRIKKIESGCVGSVSELDIRYEVPEDLDAFDYYKENGIDLYLGRTIHVVDDLLKLSVRRSPFFVKELDIQGIKLKL